MQNSALHSQSKSASSTVSGPSAVAPALQFKDARPIAQRMVNLTGIADQSTPVQRVAQLQGIASQTPVQRKGSGGLPASLKSGVEKLSGVSMNDVKVNYNSDKPTQLAAHAYAQGNQIHVASGQEKHLPHEAWHVAQQKKGQVQPTSEIGGVKINDNPGLEREADVMGAKALKTGSDLQQN